MDYFKTLKATTKQAQRFIDQYQSTANCTLWDCYTTFSRAKQNAFEYCEQRAYSLNGYGRKIISYNTSFFTYAFMFDMINEETNIIENYLAIITKSNEYIIKL